MQKIVQLNLAILYCCMVVMFCLQQRVYAAPAQGKPVSLTIKNSSLAEVLRQVSKKSGLYIYFQDADLAGHRNVSLDAKNKPVESVLHELLDERGFSWVEVSENTIAVKKKLEKEGKVEMDTVSTITVTGKVVDEKGEPVIGATVVVKGGKIGTTTNEKGEFVLSGVKSNGGLVVSNISFLTEELPVKGRANFGKIKLRQYIGKLDETVVVAYGTTTKRFDIGSSVSIKSEDIEKQPVNNLLNVLQGRVTGLQVTPTSGLPGGAVNIQLRGRNTLRNQFSGNAEPLFVIDGLPVVNNMTGLGGAGLGQISTFSFLSPSDIESIDILKDAEATSIYGSRGANGVILITTKKGVKGNNKFDLNIQEGIANVSKKVDLLKTPQYIELRQEAFTNDGIDFVNTFPYNNPDYKYILAPDLFVWSSKKNTDWQDALIGGTAKYHDIKTSISGGNATVQYMLGGNFHKETTVFPGDNSDQKGNVHISITGNSVDEKFKSTVSASYLVNKTNLPGIDFTSRALTLSPNSPEPYTKEGDLNWAISPLGSRSWSNPYAELFKTYDAKITNLISSADLSYKLFPFLSLKTQIGYSELTGRAFRKTYPFAGREPENLNSPGASSFNTNSARNISIEPQINFIKNITKGKLEVLLGGSYQSSIVESENLDAFGFTSDALLRNIASATMLSGINTRTQYKYSAVFGKVRYNWDNKYLINISARRDGSSRFGPGKQFGNFAGLGLGWIFSQEKFIKDALQFMSFGKLRFSYGSSGNDGIGDYQYYERYQPITNVNPYQGITSYRTTGLFNPYYAWEVTRKMEIGLETGFLRDQIFFTANYFRNRSSNQLLSYPTPSMAGPGNLLFNLPALIQNMGLEFTLNSENIRSEKFSWSTSINFTRNRNKLVSFPDLSKSAYYNTYEVGQPFAGIARTFNFAGVDPATGLYQFNTIDGKLTSSPDDATRLDGGKYLRVMTDPKYYGGISNTFTYRRFSLDFFVQFTKQLGVNPNYQYVFIPGYNISNLPSDYQYRWQKSGDKSEFQKVTGTYSPDLVNYIDRVRQSDRGYVDASFIRLKNVSVSYKVPELSKQRLHNINIRVYAQAQNLLTITSYNGLDPETQSTSLPPLRVITAGLQISL